MDASVCVEYMHINVCRCVCVCFILLPLSLVVGDSFVTESKAFFYFHEFITSRRLIHGFHVNIRMWFRKSAKMLSVRLKPFVVIHTISMNVCMDVSISLSSLRSLRLLPLSPKSCHNQWRIHENYYYYNHLFIWNMVDSFVFNILLYLNQRHQPGRSERKAKRIAFRNVIFAAATATVATAATEKM